MQNSTKISAILITKNESANIERCLNSLFWVDEIIMVDSLSTDNTVALALNYKNVKVISAEWKGFTENKKLAVKNTSYDWVVWLDADEEISKELQYEIQQTLTIPNKKQAYDVPRKTFFLGEWVQHTGWYPGRVIRVFNKNYCSFNDNILHEGLEIQDPTQLGQLKSDILHYSYTSLYQYFDKMNYYGKSGAEELVRKKKKFQLYKLILNPLSTFIKFYFIKKGFLDGYKGLIISIGSAFSNFIKYTNFYYLTKRGKL